MLRVYHSNRLDVLEALMEFIVERERLDDPFEPEMILVQSTGMAQWLQMTLSQKFAPASDSGNTRRRQGLPIRRQ